MDGNCPGWELSEMGIDRWELSGMGNGRDGNCPVGIVRYGNCPGWELSGNQFQHLKNRVRTWWSELIVSDIS